MKSWYLTFAHMKLGFKKSWEESKENLYNQYITLQGPDDANFAKYESV